MRDIFLANINDDPDDDSLKLVYADWLEEQGDAAAIGWRWIVETKRQPSGSYLKDNIGIDSWIWYAAGSPITSYHKGSYPYDHSWIPHQIFSVLQGGHRWTKTSIEYPSRSEAWDMLAIAYGEITT